MTPVFEPPPVVSSGLYDNFVLNPVEFTPDLPEVDLRDGGIQIGPGAPNLGEATVNVERIKRLIGEGVTGRQLGTVECEIPLLPGIDRYISQAASFEPLEAFVGDVQRGKIRWIRHDFKEVGGFAGSLATFVDNASIPKPYGGEVAELTLKLSRHPIWYATAEILAGEASGTNVRELEFELAELLGTAPGLIRLVVTNEGAEDWRGCMVAIECDSFSSDATAKPSYEAKELTPKGGAAVATVSSAEVIKCPPLTAGWQTVLSSEITGVGHMTHVDPRRMLFRLNDVSSVLDDVQWKLEWRQLGQAAWVQTMEASTPIVRSSPVIGGYQLLDLGECRPERPIAGQPRFECRLQARSLSGSGKQPLIRDVYPMTIEQWMRVADFSDNPIDGEPSLPAQLYQDATGVGTVTWNTTNVDGIPAKAELGPGVVSHYVKFTNLGLAIPSASTVLGITAVVTIFNFGASTSRLKDVRARIIKAGVVKEAVDRARAETLAIGPVDVTYGGPSDLFGLSWTPAEINASNFGLALALEGTGSGTAKAQIYNAVIKVAYSEGANQNRVCFASRSLELADDGVRRQHITDDVQGVLIPEGLDLQAPIPGQAAQPMRALIIPSVGDFAARADSSAVKPGAKLYYRPGYLGAREAS